MVRAGAEKPKWAFAQNHDGEERGFHDAGVETFKGNFERYLAREAIQNSLDARHDGKHPVLVKFELLDLAASDVPDLEGLQEAFRRCANYWDGDEKAKAFFKRAEKLAKQPKVAALRIGDFNTTGVLGGDKDRARNWYNLVRCSGSSSKWAGEGGSFGIGKNAPFAASMLRTVLYSTFNVDGEHIFQGVARLVTHERPKVGTVQATGFLGSAGGSIREKSKIPQKFIRAKRGTDLVILGYQAEPTWRTDLIHSVLENFWPAIHRGDLDVLVDDTRITTDSLRSLLESYSSHEDFTAQIYYNAFTSPEAKRSKKKLPTLGEATVHLLAGRPDLPKKVAMVRKTGMVIYQKRFHSVVPFCGVFVCRNDAGNRILREMEPPRHDDWDPDHPEKAAHKKTADEFASYIRDCIKELAPVDNQKVLTIPELNQYLPDDEESPEEGFEGEPDNGSGKAEGFTARPTAELIKGKRIERKPRIPPSAAVAGEEEVESDAGGEEGDVGDGDGDGGGGNGADSGGKAKEGGDGKNPKSPIAVRCRVVPKDLAAGAYTLTIRSVERVKGGAVLSISAVGDDASAPIAVTTARLAGGKKVDITQSGKLGPVVFPKAGPLRIEIVLKDPQRLAMEVHAHEA